MEVNDLDEGYSTSTATADKIFAIVFLAMIYIIVFLILQKGFKIDLRISFLVSFVPTFLLSVTDKDIKEALWGR